MPRLAADQPSGDRDITATRLLVYKGADPQTLGYIAGPAVVFDQPIWKRA